jgi:hypothetical protein
MPSLWVKTLATSLAWLLSNGFISYFMVLNLNAEFSPFIACENKFGSSLCPMSTSDSGKYTTWSLRIVDLLIL